MRTARTPVLGSLVAVLLVSSLAADSFVLDPPSPSWPDSDDILVDSPGPISAVPRLGIAGPTLGLGAQDVIDAISDGRDPIDEDKHGPTALLFSVHRGSLGAAGTDVNAEQVADTVPPAGAVPNGHASDLFYWAGTVGQNVLAPAGLGWTLGTQTGDEANTRLRPAGGGSPGDDVTAYDISTMRCPGQGAGDDDGGPGGPCGGAGGGAARPVFFSLRAGSPTLAAIGAGPGDILVSGGAYGVAPTVFLSAAMLGIPPQADLDALALEIEPTAAGLVAHRALFSVHRNTVGFLIGGVVVDSGATVLHYDGAVTTISHPYADLGLLLADDLDALESILDTAVGGLPELPPIIVVPEGGAEVVPWDGGFGIAPLSPENGDGVLFQFPYATGIEATLLFPAVQAVGSTLHLELPILGLEEENGGLDMEDESPMFALVKEAEGFRVEIELPASWNGGLELLSGEALVHEATLAEGQGRIEAYFAHELKNVLVSSYLRDPDGAAGPEPVAVMIEWSSPGDSGVIEVAGDAGQRQSGDRLRLRLALPRLPGAQVVAFSGLEVGGRTNGIIAILIGLLHPGMSIDGHSVTRLGEALLAPVDGGIEVSGFTVGSDQTWGNHGFLVAPPSDGVNQISFNFDRIDWSRATGAAPTLRLAGELRTRAKALPPRIEAGVAVLPTGDYALAASFGPEVDKVEVLATLGGQPVGSLRTAAGQIGRLTGTGELVQTDVGRRGFLFGFDAEMTLTVGSGATLSGDAFRIAPVGGGFEDAVLTGVEVRGSDIGTLVIARIGSGAVTFHRGDADQNGELSLTDSIATLRHLFFGDFTPVCKDAADSDDDGTLTITDPIRTLTFLFLGGISIPSPAPGEPCGEDPTDDTLDCAAYVSCE